MNYYLTEQQVDALTQTILQKQAEYFDAHKRFPTKLFLSRALYLGAIMTPNFMQELNRAKTFMGMELYQAIRIFGEPKQPVVVVSE